jgi:methylglyoxal reductase
VLDQVISKLGYGAWGLSGELGAFDRGEARRSILAYLDGGGNFIDTARAYGESERLIGETLREWTGAPPVVATKVQGHGPMRRWGSPWPVEEVFPSGSIRASAEESRRLLGVDALDLLQLHLYWPTWGASGYWLEELHALRDEGIVRRIGVSLPDFRPEVGLPAVLWEIVDSVQTIVNVFDPLALDCLVPMAAERDIAVIARGALDEGGLSGAIEADSTFAEDDIRSVYFAPENLAQYGQRLDRLRRFVPEHASSLANLALRFVAGQPGVTTVIVSMASEQLVRENLATFAEPPLPSDVVDELRTRHRWVRNFFTPAYWR